MTDWIVGSSILIVMIFAIRKVFGMRISSRFRYALWAVVMIRLLCPVTLWNNQQLVHNITEVSRQMFQNTSGTKVDKVDSNAELGMENGQNAGVGDASNTDRTKNDYTGNVKNQNVNMGQQNEQEISKLHLDIMFSIRQERRQRHNSLKKIHSQKIAILTYSTV